MEATLAHIDATLQEHIQTACGQLMETIHSELQTLQEHASRLRDHEERAKEIPEPSCTLRQHTSMIQDYKDLKTRHGHTLSLCNALTEQNERLQAENQDLLAKSDKERREPMYQLGTSYKSMPQIDSETKHLIEENPKMKAIFEQQAMAYNKMRNAHSTLVGRLRESQNIIRQMENKRTTSVDPENQHQARMAQLKDVIGQTTSRSTSPQLPAMPRATSLAIPAVSAIQNQPASKSSTTMDELEGPPSITTPRYSDPEIINIVSSDPPESGTDMASPARVSSPAPVPGIIARQVVEVSQPEFVSERPVKRRKVRQSTSKPTSLIKSETITTEFGFLNQGSTSIDLNSMHTPINPCSRGNPSFTRTSSDRLRRIESISSDPDSRQNDHTVVIKNEYEQQHRPRTADADYRIEAPAAATPVGRQLPQPLQPRNPNIQILAPRRTTDTIVEARKTATRKNVDTIDGDHSRPTTETTPAAKPARPENWATSLKKKRMAQQKPLRDKALHELTINDFKLNPAMNQGFNDAMGTHGQNKRKRDCPAECSRPECCGNAFLAAVRNAGLASLSELTQQQKDDLVSEHLGFHLSDITISDKAYNKLLGEAVGKQFAMKYGKEKGSRAVSPPGYWRVDFPTTQERAADREEAEAQEQATIADRRREALRGDGLWLFRDE